MIITTILCTLALARSFRGDISLGMFALVYAAWISALTALAFR